MFLIGFVACAATFVYHGMGFELTKQTLDGENRRGPLVVMRLDKLDGTTSTDFFLDRFYQPRLALLIAADAKVILKGQIAYVPIGEVAGEWDLVSIARMRRSVDYSNVSTSPEYRLLELSGADHIAASKSFVVDAPVRSTLKGSIVAVVAYVVEDQQAVWLNMVAESTDRFDGGMVWSAPLAPLTAPGDLPLNVVAALQFTQFDDAVAWLSDARRAADFAIASVIASNVHVMVVDSL